MSWDVLLLKEKCDLNDKDVDVPPLGNRDEIIRTLTALMADLDYSDPTWGILESDEFSIEFNTGREELVDSIMLHIRGGGDPLIIIKLICDHTGWGAFDTSTSDFMDTDKLSPESWLAFQKFRDRVIGK